MKSNDFLCEEVRLRVASIEAIEIETVFSTFKEFWRPFNLGTGPAPDYYMSLEDAQRNELKEFFARNIGPEEPVNLKAKACAVQLTIR